MTPLRRYYRGHDLTTIVDVPGATTRYFHYDHQGTTQALTDQTGAVTDRFASDAWGVQVKRSGTNINRNWYVGSLGYYRQLDRQLDYVRARHLDLPRGGWLSRDLASGQRLYGYSDSNPSKLVDPLACSPSALWSESSASPSGRETRPSLSALSTHSKGKDMMLQSSGV